MNRPPRYHSGQDVKAGDRILHSGNAGHVIFVLGHGPLPEQWGGEAGDWFIEHLGKGFMIFTEETGHLFMAEADEDLHLVSRIGETQE